MRQHMSGAFLTVTQKCNLKCKYCFVHQKPKEVTLELAKDVADYLAENALKNTMEFKDMPFSPPSINFFGGEPLLKWHDVIVPLTEYIREKYGQFELSMTSNGLLLDREKLEYMKDNKFGLLLSVDGDQITQDKNRPRHDGSGSFEDTDKIIDLVLEYYPNMTFRATIDNDTAKYLYDNYLYAESKGYTNAFFIPNTSADWSEEQINHLKVNLKKITDRIIEKKSKGERYVEFSHLQRALGELRKLNSGNTSKATAQQKCGIGTNKFCAIGVDGNIYTCQELVGNDECKDFIIGNIYTEINEQRRSEIINSFDGLNIRSSKEGACNICELEPICDGQCVINNYFNNGSLNIMDYTLCQWHQMNLEQAKRLEGK